MLSLVYLIYRFCSVFCSFETRKHNCNPCSEHTAEVIVNVFMSLQNCSVCVMLQMSWSEKGAVRGNSLQAESDDVTMADNTLYCSRETGKTQNLKFQMWNISHKRSMWNWLVGVYRVKGQRDFEFASFCSNTHGQSKHGDKLTAQLPVIWLAWHLWCFYC